MYRWMFTVFAALNYGPVSSETLNAFLARDGSHAMLTLDIPFDLLQKIILAELQDQYSGTKPDPTDTLVEDTLTWSAQPSPISLEQQDDCLTASGSAKGTVRVKGKADLLLSKVPVSASSDLRAEASLTSCPRLNSDWSLDPSLSGNVQLTEVDVYGLSLRGILQNDLDRAVSEALNRITSDLLEPSILRQRVGELWKSVCELTGDGKVFSVRPSVVAATQPQLFADKLRISFVVSGDVMAHQEPAVPCPALPKSLVLLE